MNILKRILEVPEKPSAPSQRGDKVDENAFACLIVFNFDLDILASRAP
jgi:hypothetical protein